MIYNFRCINEIPKNVESKKNVTHYCDILEMYISIFTVLSNCIIHSNEYTVVVNFSPESLYAVFSFLNTDLYRKLKTEINYNIVKHQVIII